MDTQIPSDGKAPPAKLSLRNDYGFDAFQYNGSYISFFENFLGYYKILKVKPPSTLIDMKENHFLER